MIINFKDKVKKVVKQDKKNYASEYYEGYEDEYGHVWNAYSFSGYVINGSGERTTYSFVCYGRDEEEARDIVRSASFNDCELVLKPASND